mmetsp:Transcript_64010/g.113854  ORF Transcript_64010/g.113854 Transcript_64010/m.113854 type:complete len:682 (+) Transcript_64010:87-2132(+)
MPVLGSLTKQSASSSPEESENAFSVARSRSNSIGAASENRRSRSRSKEDRSRGHTKDSAMTDVSKPDAATLAEIPDPSAFGPRPQAPSSRQASEGLGETGLGERAPVSQVSPVSPMSPKVGRTSSLMSPKSARSGASWAKSNTTASWQSFGSIDQTPPGMIDLNRPGVIPLVSFALAWAAAAACILFSIVVIYRFQEVIKLYNLAEESAIAHSQLQVVDILSPASAAMEAVQAALAGGMLQNLSDYRTIANIMRPVFASRKGVLREIEVAGPPSSPKGSLLIKPIPGSYDVSIITDRDDCELVPGQRGCSSSPLSAATEKWYKDAFGIDRIWSYVPSDATWSGPVFVRSDQHVSICEQLCWEPTFTFVGRAKSVGGTKATLLGVPQTDPGGTTTSTTTRWPILDIVVVRAVVSAKVLQEVVSTAELLSKGQAILCTESGDVIAAADMASAVSLDDETGQLRVAKVWEASNSWASVVSEELVEEAEKGVYLESGDFTVTARKLEGPNGDALNLGERLRIVMGTPTLSFMEPTLFSLTWFCCGVSATPAAVMVLAMMVALLLKRRKKKTGAVSSPGSSPGGLSASLSKASLKMSKFRMRAGAQNQNLAVAEARPTYLKAFGLAKDRPTFMPSFNAEVKDERDAAEQAVATEQDHIREQIDANLGRRLSTESRVSTASRVSTSS